MLKSQVLSTELLQSMDCVAVLTDHSVLDYALIAASAPLIFDTRNALTDFPKANVVRL
jgi:UDP-N-acetyl-D-glucosamine dehydrogenase